MAIQTASKEDRCADRTLAHVGVAMILWDVIPCVDGAGVFDRQSPSVLTGLVTTTDFNLLVLQHPCVHMSESL